MSWFRKRNKSSGKEELGDVEFDDINFKGATKIYEFEGTCELGANAYLTLKQGGEFYLKANTVYYYEAQSVGIEITTGIIKSESHFGTMKRFGATSMVYQDIQTQAYEGTMGSAHCEFEIDSVNHRIRIRAWDGFSRTTNWKVLVRMIEVTI